MTDFEFKDRYNIDDLVRIMRVLRSENGCPWDRVQTHESIRNNLLEEAYETADAVDTGDRDALCEELGDMLMQVVFHAEIANEDKEFDFDDVCDGVVKKLVNRHPHVFGAVNADTVDAVLTTWEDVKKREKHQSTYTDTLRSVPNAFPALMKAQKVQKRAAKAGFDWDSADGAFEKIAEESDELRRAVQEGDKEQIAEEFGDLLFSAVNTGRLLGLDCEESLSRATQKFVNRFEKVEILANERGIDMAASTLEELDKLWDEVKHDF